MKPVLKKAGQPGPGMKSGGGNDEMAKIRKKLGIEKEVTRIDKVSPELEKKNTF